MNHSTNMNKTCPLHPVVILLTALLLLLGLSAISPADAKAKSQSVWVPQNVYSVSNKAPAFPLNAKATTRLTYHSTQPAVASVSPAGTITVHKPGRTTIVIRAAATKKFRSASRSVTVVVSRYKKTNGKYAESMGNFDHKRGDRKNLESGIYRYEYNRSLSYRNWNFIIRCNDPVVADKAALAVSYIVRNKHFGFLNRYPTSQRNVNKRASIYRAVVKKVGKYPTKRELRKIRRIKKYADTSCTPTLMAGYWLYYDMDTQLSLKYRPPYHKRTYRYHCGAANVEARQLVQAIRQVNREYTSRGMLPPFKIIYVKKSKRKAVFSKSRIKKYLKRGDIICSCTNPKKNGHTAMMQ